MATFKSTIKSTLTAATSTLEAATKTINAAAMGADMLHAFMEAELADQRISYKLNSGTRTAEQVVAAKQAIADLQISAANYVRKSAEHAAAYKSASTYIDSIVDELGIQNMPKISIE